MIKKIFFFKKTTHLTINLKSECTDTLIYIGCTVEFAKNILVKQARREISSILLFPPFFISVKMREK